MRPVMRRAWSGLYSLVLCIAAAPAPGQALTPAQKQLRGISQELVEIDTTDSAGNNTKAAEAMAARLRAGGIPAGDVHVIVPPGGPKKGNLVARLKGTG